MSEKKGISRRQFLTGAAVTAAAVSLPAISGVAPAAAAVTDAAFPYATPNWTPLDAKALARQAYEIYKGAHSYQVACCEATFWPIIGELRNRYPDTWGNIPKGVFNYGKGGVNVWRSLCGCSNGGAACLSIVTGNSNLVDNYMAWYEKTALPSNATYLDYASTTWVPGGNATLGWGAGTGKLPIPYNNAPKSKALSVLCHDSLQNWRKNAKAWEAAKGVPAGQSDRCGKLCYDSVYKMAQMVNAFKAGTAFSAGLDPSTNSCGSGTGTGCHGPLGAGTQADAKMQCTPCHDQRPGDGHNL